LSLKEILLRNKEEKRRKKNESSRRSYNKLHKSAKEKVYSESCEAKRKRKLRQETKQKIDEKKLKNKLRVKRHREKIKIAHEKLHMYAFFLVTQMFFETEWKNQEHLRN
jgi:HD-GYP domain-containing protein (c-di-GMP phosphodiesterase class II)